MKQEKKYPVFSVLEGGGQPLTGITRDYNTRVTFWPLKYAASRLLSSGFAHEGRNSNVLWTYMQRFCTRMVDTGEC